jgi:hypothetical protein
MKPVFLLVPLLLLVPISSQTAEFPEDSGNAFLRLCSAAEKGQLSGDSDEQVNIMACVGYVKGVMHGMWLERGAAEAQTGRTISKPYCHANDVENGQIVRIVLKYIRDNPADANKPTALLIVRALAKAYPCPSK